MTRWMHISEKLLASESFGSSFGGRGGGGGGGGSGEGKGGPLNRLKLLRGKGSGVK